MSQSYDATIVGSGPNGLAAAIELARAGFSVCVLEAAAEPGGGLRTAELTLPGFAHDICSAAHPMGVLSPWFRSVPLQEHGLRWLRPPASVAHPLPDAPSVMLRRSLTDTAAELGEDAAAYRRLFEPHLRQPDQLLADLMGPLRLPKHPFALARFGLPGLLPASFAFRTRFRGERARALLAGCAAHSILPFESPLTSAVGMIFALTGHMEDWPVAEGGSASIARAMVSYLEELGGEVRTGVRVDSLEDLPTSRVVLFDTSPNVMSRVAADALPQGYHRRLARYCFGPGVFKLDWALDGPIPWRDSRTLEASTVHLGGTLAEIAAAEGDVWKGRHPERPFVLLVQQSQFDATRAPAGQHTGYAYCHVPNGSTVDQTQVVEDRIEEFAPGFRDRILGRHVMTTSDFERYNANYVGGAVTGGAADITQFFTRPVARLDPYSTPNPRIFMCSASTPPGGGVHGMCGFFAARGAMARLNRGVQAQPWR